ncbi:hypothetical protein V474_13455 [Novosphingobium barchaimii LL02]|uniref:Peptidase S9 prolyl oligopeptidase catalytic domain-containing protein n=1 Tax=Novosphingobium barchaimii LL02 TaxID=1114963 RepID=A0A0J7XXR0_9SPHN|nr:Atxe2 family lasso peptide isopeptidase [Novosphingobium barchaimii]KMS56018.1 hypothetical protein V474_13455 [Novosphingobium barchaimii LL02]
MFALLAFSSIAFPGHAFANRCALPAPGASPTQPGEIITARDLSALRDFGDLGVAPTTSPFELSPRGDIVALRLRQADADNDTYCTSIVLVPTDPKRSPHVVDDGGDIVSAKGDIYGLAEIPVGTPKATFISWSPSGAHLAYTKVRGSGSEIWVYDHATSSVRQIFISPVDIQALAWSSDGKRILFTSRVGETAALEKITAEGRNGYHYDDRFWPLSSDRPLLSSAIPSVDQAVDLESGRPKEFDVRDVDALRPRSNGPKGSLAFAQIPAGSRSAWTTQAGDGSAGKSELHVSVGARQLTCHWETCSNIAMFWWTTGKGLLYQRRTGFGNSRTEFYTWQPGTAAPRLLLSTTDALFGCRMADDRLICAQETSTNPRKIVAISPNDGGRAPLFEPNPDFAHFSLGEVRRLEWANDFGIATFGDLVLPPGYHRGAKLPLVIVQYDSRGFLRGGTGDEYPIQPLAAQGFAVLSFNRPPWYGSLQNAGDELASMKASIKGWGDRKSNLSSLNSIIVQLADEGIIDAKRVAITGLSDGASTATFALSNSTLFSAAILSTCCEAASTLAVAGDGLYSFYTSIGYPRSQDESQLFWQEGSLIGASAARPVPVLIQASSDEYRMALMTYRNLKDRGWPIDMYVYPNEGHVKTSASHRLSIYLRNIDWLKTQFSVVPENPN